MKLLLVRSSKQKMSCPHCESERVIVLQSRIKANGDRRRRYKCEVCLERWTLFEDGAAPPKPKPSFVVRSTRLFTDAQAEAIMLSSKSSSALAAEYGVTRQAVDQIRQGQSYANIYARLQEEGHQLRSTGSLLCESCVHWCDGKGCSFGFPDAGGDFATDCYLYREL